MGQPISGRWCAGGSSARVRGAGGGPADAQRRSAMEAYVGLDVSLDETSICILDGEGRLLKECKAATEPEAIAGALSGHRGRLVRVGLEAQALSPWLYGELLALGFPVVVVETQHMKAALGAMRNKTDKNDARGIAQMMRLGWFRQVHVKSRESMQLRLLLANRRLLKRKFLDVENELRGTLKAFGVKIGKVSRGRFEARTLELLETADPMLRSLAASMLQVRRMLWAEVLKLHALVVRVVRDDPVCRRFMTVPGVGPIAALTFKAAVDDPRRFRRSRTVGAHFGLTPRRFQSGTIDIEGRISKCGEVEVRTALYEAASGLLIRCRQASELRTWGLGLVKRRGHKRALVAVARKIATVLHRMWLDGSDFRPAAI